MDTKEKEAPSKEQSEQAVKEFLTTARDIVLYESDRDADPSNFGFFFTMFEHPGERWWNVVVEDRLFWIHEDNYQLFKMYSSMFGFRFKDGHTEMMICPNVPDETRDKLRKNDKTKWATGSALLSVPVSNSGYAIIRAVPLDKFDIRPTVEFDSKYITEKRVILESKAKELFEMKAYDRLREVTDVLESEWMTIEGT